MFTPDKALRGLYIKQLASGSKWVVRARQRGTPNTVSVTIGRTDVLTPAQARAEAKQALAALSRGENPNQVERIAAEEERRLRMTLREAIDEFLEAKRLKHKPATTLSYRSVMERSFSDWMKRPIGEITGHEVTKRFNDIQRKVERTTKWTKQANTAGVPEALKAMRYLNAVLNYFVLDEYCGKRVLPKGNPVAIFKIKANKPKLQLRKRYLKDLEREDLLIELSHVHHPQYNGRIRPDTADFLFLMLLTGLRKREAETLRWEYIDFNEELMTIPDTKNSREHYLPLTEAVKATLERRRTGNSTPFVFPNKRGNRPADFRYAVKMACKQTGIKFTSHDMRRTVAQVASEEGYSLDQVGALLNHANGTVTAGYVARTLKTVKPILQAIEDALLKPYASDPNPPEPTEADDAALGLATPASNNVLPFRAGRQRKQQG
jgi:integrase